MQVTEILTRPGRFTLPMLSSLTSAAASRFADPVRSFGIAVSSVGARRLVEPGDVLYVYDQAAAVTGDASVWFSGQLIRPLEVTVEQVAWSVHQQQGVWLYRPNESQPWTELSPWVDYGDGTSQWQVSSGWSMSDITLIGGPNRLQPSAPRLVAS